MSIEPIAPEFQKPVPTETGKSFAEVGSLFQAVLLEEAENITKPTPNPMPQPVEDGGAEGPTIRPMDALVAMAGAVGGDWTYNREKLMSEVDTFLTALGVDHHDIKEITEMFPPEGAELDLVRMGKLVTKAGDILAGRVDAAKLAALLPDSGMSEAQVQSWLTALGVEYQRTGELMKADGEVGGAFNSTLVEENLVTNLVNTLPKELSISDLTGLLAGTVGENFLYSTFGALIGDLGKA